MRAIWITKHGGPEVLAVAESPDPVPGEGEIRIAVRAAGLNFTDVAARKGVYREMPDPPSVPGAEGAGVVEAVGPGVTRWKVGDRVLFLTNSGAQSSAICVDQRAAFGMPDEMTFEEGGAFSVAYVTAYHMLYSVRRVRPGDAVLVHMAAGSTGTAVLQLCRCIGGVKTFGTASARKHDHVRANGCDHPIDYHTTDYVKEVRRVMGDEGLDLVLDPLGGEDWRKGYSLLAPGGLLVGYGLANGSLAQGAGAAEALADVIPQPVQSVMKLMADNRGVAGVSGRRMFKHMGRLTAEMEAIIALYREGKLRPHIWRVFPFDRVVDAHAELESGRNVGKVVLTPA